MSFFIDAPAKINLNFHLIGRRESDGYHLVDGLFVFVKAGDRLRFESSDDGLSLVAEGEFGANLKTDDSNLVIKAAKALALELDVPLKAKITLYKNLPIASGIGGGSADAAATLKGLQKLWGKTLQQEKLDKLALSLGADVPICLYAKPAMVSGIGEVIKKAPILPPEMPIILVNPNKEVCTKDVFQTREKVYSSPFEFAPKYDDVFSLVKDLQKTKNDLTNAAIKTLPVIENVLNALDAENALFSGMSGSGATCFGIYEKQEDALFAAEKIKKQNPLWWVSSSSLI